MRTIKGIELVISAMGRWKPSDLVRIVDFQYVYDTINTAWNVNMEAEFQRRDTTASWPSAPGKVFVISMCFMKVRRLHVDIRNSKFGDQNGDFQVVGFDVTDMSDSGMEDLNFYIEDYEDDMIEFYCKDIVIESVREGSFCTHNTILTSPFAPNEFS
ncbi:MAG: hypothetical protein FWE67_00780 [Planctomycetaceae bacterium]|nr:hypothetical protein [Planctomycetaceae bacterium]